MALQKNLTDNKGVKTTYHKIRAVEFNDDTIKLHIDTYIGATQREAEKTRALTNKSAREYQAQLDTKHTQLDKLMKKNTDKSLDAEVAALTAEINALAEATDRPIEALAENLAYARLEIEIENTGQNSLAQLYASLKQLPEFKGATDTQPEARVAK